MQFPNQIYILFERFIKGSRPAVSTPNVPAQLPPAYTQQGYFCLVYN